MERARASLTTPAAVGVVDGSMSNSGHTPDRSVRLEDADDIRASCQGDGEAYRRLIRRYQDCIGRYIWRFTRQPSEHEILLQSVFVEAYFSLSRFKGSSPLEHWLMRIATRVGYRYWRQRKRTHLEPLPRLDEAAAMDPSPAESAELVHALLARLSPRDRLVLTLMHLEERSVAEVATLTGWSQSMVKVQAFRARAHLRRLLEAEGLA